MLIAVLNRTSVEATDAPRGLDYRCPNPLCNGPLILRKGRLRIHHFGHKPPMTCDWSAGETKAHLEAKKLVCETLKGRNLKAKAEFVVDTLPGDRRADVMTWHPDGRMVAFELQHTSISLDEIEKRAFAYARANVAQIWIPFLRQSVWNDAEPVAQGFRIDRYSPRPFEKWVHGLNGKNGMFMYDPRRQSFWRGRLAACEIYVEETNWFGEGGEEKSAGGFYRTSKRYRELSLQGPFSFHELLIKLSKRRKLSLSTYNWPEGWIASLIAKGTEAP